MISPVVIKNISDSLNQNEESTIDLPPSTRDVCMENGEKCSNCYYYGGLCLNCCLDFTETNAEMTWEEYKIEAGIDSDTSYENFCAENKEYYLNDELDQYLENKANELEQQDTADELEEQ